MSERTYRVLLEENLNSSTFFQLISIQDSLNAVVSLLCIFLQNQHLIYFSPCYMDNKTEPSFKFLRQTLIQIQQNFCAQTE